MVSRFEYNVQSGKHIEVDQTVYQNEVGEIIVLDSGLPPPHGYTEFTGDLSALTPPEEG